VDSRAGTGDTSLPSLQWIGPGVGQGDGSPRVRPGQRQSPHYVLTGSWRDLPREGIYLENLVPINQTRLA